MIRMGERKNVVLVTGGNGLFGRKLVLRLLQDTDVSDVVSMDLVPPKEIFLKSIEKYAGKFYFVLGDISQIEDVLTVIKSFSVQKVAHFAYQLSVIGESIPRASAKVNILGTCNVFEAARLLGVSRVLYVSSIAVYGPQTEYEDREILEDDRLHPSDIYGLTKQLNERLAGEYSNQYGMSIIGIRPSVGFGHGGRLPEIVKRFSSIVSLPAIGKRIRFDVEGSRAVSLVCVDDLAEFSKIVLDAASPIYPIYNLAAPPVSLLQVANHVRQYIPNAKIEFGHKSEVGWLPTKISSARAKEEFGFSLRPLEEAVLIHINDARREAGLELIKA